MCGVGCAIKCSIRKRFLRYLGHVERMGDETLQRKVLHSRLGGGTQCRGKPPMNYRNTMLKSLNSFGISTLEWMELVKNRASWYKMFEFDGVCNFMKQWLIDNMNKRRLKVERAEVKR